MLLLMLLLCAQASALTLSVDGAAVDILPAQIEGETWLFLPAFADLANLFPEACRGYKSS